MSHERIECDKFSVIFVKTKKMCRRFECQWKLQRTLAEDTHTHTFDVSEGLNTLQDAFPLTTIPIIILHFDGKYEKSPQIQMKLSHMSALIDHSSTLLLCRFVLNVEYL